MAGENTDLNSTLQGVVDNLSAMVQAFQNAFPRINGTFTLGGGTTTVVTQPSIAASGIPMFVPTNATAALTQRTGGLYVSAVTAGVSFSISTQSGTTFGTETFKYIVINPS